MRVMFLILALLLCHADDLSDVLETLERGERGRRHHAVASHRHIIE